ncbi:uracil-DNA glycosylase [Candidatus Woesearchaeota archaeon CG10_big_fil_rev_8_21_14_0_10_45_16]|nr:MAG: uracil-DNA glycosylase [Candidatus Woesearchaeota archaeon CG10_big_fil_rev_8_21_14_0_10_45_16]
MADTLFSLAEGIRKCTACPLWRSRTLAVPGEGAGKIMVVAEAPGVEEDRTGKLFMGRSGKFLDEMLKMAGLDRKNIFLTGSVKCHPPQNRKPVSRELKTCKELWLDKQMSMVEPELIVVLGGVALKSLLNKSKVDDLHGKLIDGKYFVTYHPAAAMRFPSVRKKMEEDMTVLKRLL